MEAFGDILEPGQSRDSTRVGFQNCEPQPQYKTNKKVMDGARTMAAGKYDVLLFAEHDLYGPTLEPKHQMDDWMCVTNKGTMTRLSYNTNDGPRTKWNQYGGTGFTINADMRARITQKGWGNDLTKLGRWTWTRIGGKDGIATVFVSAYRHVTAQIAHIRYGGSKQDTLKNTKIFETQMCTPYSFVTCAGF